VIVKYPGDRREFTQSMERLSIVGRLGSGIRPLLRDMEEGN
jgi:hypothetical protein